MRALEAAIRRLTQPVNGQFPRPWMTDMTNPERARIFVIGYNQATSFAVHGSGGHDACIDALFNRNGRSCRQLYAQARGPGGPSRTRKNLDALSEHLAGVGLLDVVETNVVCYSTPMSSDLLAAEHSGGKAAGRALFQEILTLIRPPVLIVHGARAARELGVVLGQMLPPAAKDHAAGVSSMQVPGPFYGPMVFVIPSLAPPAWNVWSKWAPQHLADLCIQVREFLDHPQPGSGA